MKWRASGAIIPPECFGYIITVKENNMKVRFHLPEFSSHFRFNLLWLTMMENCPEYFRDGIEIASFYGVFPPALWNGGRSKGGYVDKDFIRNVIKTFNGKNIPLRFTFTNPCLEKKHLSDQRCNMVLSMAHNDLNGVIVVSPLLEDYIRKNYPKYKITSSTCKRLNTLELLSEELEKDYHIVVVDYDLNNKFDILEKVPHKEKCELLVNACCLAGCPRRTTHYRSIGLQQIAYCEHIKKYPNVPFDSKKIEEETLGKNFSCPSMSKSFYDLKKMPQPTQISPDDIWDKYVPMGFSQFKIEGRTSNFLNLMEIYLYYMVKPECRDEARYRMLLNMENFGIIKINEM